MGDEKKLIERVAALIASTHPHAPRADFLEFAKEAVAMVRHHDAAIDDNPSESVLELAQLARMDHGQS